MSKNIEHLQHIKSNVVIEGKPKLPTAEVLIEGELAVNYAEGYETISLRNSNSGITTFSSDDYYTKKKLGSGFTGVNSANTVTSVIEENEEIVASALNDLNTRKLDVSAYTPTDLTNYYTKSETSGATEISNALGAKVNSQTFISHTADTNAHVTSEEKGLWNAKADKSWVEEKLGSGFTGDNSANTVTSVIRDNELIISAALNDLEDNKLDVSAYTPTDLSNYYTKLEVDAAIENVDISDQLSAYTEVSAFTEYSAATEERIDENELATTEAINDLYYRIEDFISAYTPTDFRNYYTKQETSGASEISTALSEKENTLSIDSTAKAASFIAEVGKYYIVNVPNNGSVTVTLPTTNMSSINVQNIVFLVTIGSGTASIAFTPIAFATEGFNDMEASNTYEVNALWNGTNWIMAMTKLEAVV